MEKEIEKLLSELCVNEGFCIDSESANKLKMSKHLKADEFACEILIAEGMDINMEVKWRREIRNKFIAHFGSDSVSK